MPLPHEGTPWPPKALKPALERFDTWDAWWAGDPDELRQHYQGTATGGNVVNRPSQYAGGMLGKVSRWWWGRPSPANEPEAKLHVPAPADMCRASANLLFSEPISATSPHAATNKRLAEYLDDGGHAKLLESGELVAALGGGYLRPMYDERVSDRPWTDVVAPEMAFPEWTGGKLLGVNFWRIVRVDGDRHRIVWRHVERHEPGYVVHALYQGTDDQIGRMVPLTETEQTASLAPLVSEHGAIATGYKRMTATYVPNMLPNRRFRRDPLLAPMGRSDLDGAEQLFDALDETYSSWMRDVRLAKGRVIVSQNLMENDGRGQPLRFDPDRELFAESPGLATSTNAPLTVVQFAIRVEEHRASAREWYSAILRHAGYSLRTVGDAQDGSGGGGPITAREVAAEERHSMLTRSHKIRYWRPALQEHYAAMLATDRRVFNAAVQPDEFPTLVWPDSVQEDVLSLATTAEMLNRAGAASTRTLVEMVHPEWDEKAVDAEVDRIDGANEPVIPPFDFATDQGIGRRGQRAGDRDDRDDE